MTATTVIWLHQALKQPIDIDQTALKELNRKSEKQLKLDSFTFEDENADDEEDPDDKFTTPAFTTLAYQNSRFVENEVNTYLLC